MSSNNFKSKNNKDFLSEKEYKTIQILFDYLFYDQSKYYASYSRFEECFSFLQLQLHISERTQESLLSIPGTAMKHPDSNLGSNTFLSGDSYTLFFT